MSKHYYAPISKNNELIRFIADSWFEEFKQNKKQNKSTMRFNLKLSLDAVQESLELLPGIYIKPFTGEFLSGLNFTLPLSIHSELDDLESILKEELDLSASRVLRELEKTLAKGLKTTLKVLDV